MIGIFLLLSLATQWLFEVPFYKGLLIALAFLLPMMVCYGRIEFLELKLRALGSLELMEEELRNADKAKVPPRKRASRPSKNKQPKIIKPLFQKDYDHLS
jgi:hypothetical protein